MSNNSEIQAVENNDGNHIGRNPENNEGQKPRKIGCVTIMWVTALIVGFLVWYNAFREVPLRISPETTYITEPLTADGKRVDYFTVYKAKVTPPNIATDDNGYRLIFRHFGDTAWGEKPSFELLQKLYEELELDPNMRPDPNIVYCDFYRYVDQLEKLHPEEMEETIELVKQQGGSTGPYEIATFIAEKSDKPHLFPVAKRWVEENGPALDLIGEAVGKPVFFTPIVSATEPPSLMDAFYGNGWYQESRDYARSLSLRAKYRAVVGDYDGAIDDILACHRLGRHVGRRGSMIDLLVGIAIEGIAVATALDVNTENRPSVEQFERLFEGVRNLPPRMTTEQCFEFERYFMLDQLQLMATTKENIADIFGSLPEPMGKVAPYLGYDWSFIAQQYNEWCDIVIAENVPTSGIPTGEFHTWRWLTLGTRSQNVAERLCPYWLADTFREAIRRTQCVDNLRRITLAMLIYERRNGTLPPTFTVDENGKPLHSWRVHLLPYLGDASLAELHSQIRLDEPWDSEHNRQFHERNLDIYRCPSAVKNDGEANYSVIVGDDLLFANDGQGRSLDGFKRRMILLVERKEGVCWMRPDAEISQHTAETDGINKTAASIGSNHIGGANFGLHDGSINFYSETISPNRLNELIRGTDANPEW